jgi:hypothetical protein
LLQIHMETARLRDRVGNKKDDPHDQVTPESLISRSTITSFPFQNGAVTPGINFSYQAIESREQFMSHARLCQPVFKEVRDERVGNRDSFYCPRGHMELTLLMPCSFSPKYR